VLVVLIIMMVNMPIELESLGVKVPNPLDTTPPPPASETPPEQLVIAMYKDGSVGLNRRLMTEDRMFEQITRRLRNMDPKNVFIDADNSVSWRAVVHYIDIARLAGAAKVGLAKVKASGPAPATSVDVGATARGMTLGSPVVVGYIDQVSADAAIQPWKGALEKCYLDQLGAAPDMNGRVMVRLSLGPEGQIMEHKISSSTLEGVGKELVETCIDNIAAGIKFQPLGPDHTALVQYPLLFSPG
jgi:biopolymer transport protein ExbD